MTETPGWSEVTVADCLVPVSLVGKSAVQKRDYKASGRIPVIDQGQEPIAGWTDDESTVVDASLPLVVFGDHTRIFKYVDFPFARGADGTQLLKPRPDIDPLFFFYACKAIDLQARGYNRHFSVLKQKTLPLPLDTNEQASIGFALRKIEIALTNQSVLINATEDLKRASMQKLFTHGLHGEPQAETSFGPTPASWKLTTISEIVTQTQYGLSVRGESSGRYPILRMNCQVDGKVSMHDLQFVNLDEKTAATYKVNIGDILFNRTNSYELVGRTAILEQETNATFASYLVRISVDSSKVKPHFLNYFLNWGVAQADLKKLASRGVSQANISAGKLRTFSVPIPANLVEQEAIISILDAIDRKIQLQYKKREMLEQLFKALLHKLVTGEVRVDELDLSALKVA